MKVEFGQFARPAVEVRYTARRFAAEDFQQAQADYTEAKRRYEDLLFGSPGRHALDEMDAASRQVKASVHEIRRARDLHERGGVWW